VFKLTPSGSGYKESILYRFKAGKDGEFPLAALIEDKAGALYSTTDIGGSPCGCGTVFKLTPSSKGYKETIIYTFRGGSDGSGPSGLIADKTGALYGVSGERWRLSRRDPYRRHDGRALWRYGSRW